VLKNPYSMQQGEVKKTPTLCAVRLCAELYNANCKKKRPRVDSSKMPACGACRSNVRARLRYPPKDGIDDGRAHSRDQSDRDPLHASRQGR
jgi:hypothetical protein